MDFNLPHDVIQLPSKGLFYPSKKKSLKVGYLTAEDENILVASPTKDIVHNLIRAKVYEPDVRPDDLLNGDIEAILIFLRTSAFGPEYKISAIDPETGNRFETTLILLPEEMKTIDPEIDPDENGYYSITLPKTKKAIKLKPLTLGERTEIDKLVMSYPEGRIPPVVTMKLQKQIVEIDGDTNKEKIANFVPGMPIADSRFIKKFMDANEPRLDLTRTVTAPSGRAVQVKITMGPEFFRPFF